MLAIVKLSLPIIGVFFLHQAFAQTPPMLVGPAFSNINHVVTMPDDWAQQPINRKDHPAGTDLVLSLDQYMYPSLLPLINQFASQKGLNIVIKEGTCGISAGKLKDRKADIAGFCCPPGETDRLPGLKFHTLAIASIALLVHPKNPISNVSFEQAQGLYQGKIERWGELTTKESGFNRRVRPVARLHCKPRPGHWRLLLNDESLFTSRLHDVSSISDMVRSVSTLKSSIGYEILMMVKEHNGVVKTININGQSPHNKTALLNGNYPLYRTFSMTSWSDSAAQNKQVAELINYLYKNLDRLDPQFGFIPRNDLVKAGWKFHGDELIAAPNKN
jgi:phosphate transport system substrate-binding protein